jgi:tRNA(adenine34) deaminase
MTELVRNILTPQDGIRHALAIARQALPFDVPVGAVLVDASGKIVATGYNRRERDANPAGHAEILALQAIARQRGDWRLDDLTLYVTLEPCPMCASAILQSRLARVVFGAWDPIMGAAGSRYHLFAEQDKTGVTGGILESVCAEALKTFFRQRRQPS